MNAKTKTDFEDAEKNRIAVIRNKMEQIESLCVIFDEHGDDLGIHVLKANLKLLNSYTVNKNMFNEFEREAAKLKESNIAALEEFIARAKDRRRKDAELERKAREDSARIEYEKQEAVRQKDEAKRQAEGAEKARVMAVEKAKADAVVAEKRRLADVDQAKVNEISRQRQLEEQDRLEDERRAADINHANNIKAQARNDLMDIFHIDAEFAADIVAAIDAGKISNVMISY